MPLAEGLADVAACMRAYDARTEEARRRLLSHLPAGVHGDVATKLAAAAASAERRWRAWCTGEDEEPDAQFSRFLDPRRISRKHERQ